MQLVHLAEILDADEQECLAQLHVIQATPRGHVSAEDLAWLKAREATLVKQMNQTRRARNMTRVCNAIVVITTGGVG